MSLEVTPEEIASIEDYKYVNTTRLMSLTFGMEIEQPAEFISHELRRAYSWHYDGSGPLETSLPPSSMPNVQIKRFVDTVNSTNSRWIWVNEYYRPGFIRIAGCGSHLHFRPRDDLYANTPRWAEVWAITHNTFVEVMPFLLPLLAWGSEEVHKHYIRRTASYWAVPQIDRVTPQRVAENYLIPSYVDHPYRSVAFDRKTPEHVLTIELRLGETHPVVAAYFATMMEKLIKRCIDRGWSPRIVGDRRYILEKIYDAMFEHSRRIEESDITPRLGDYIDNYLRELGITEIVFDPPIPPPTTGIPPLARFKSYYDVFDKLLYHYTTWIDWQLRLYYFYRQRGIPIKNAMAFWYIFAPKGQFRWEEETLRSPPDEG